MLAEVGFSREQIAKATGLKKSSLRVYFSNIGKMNGKTEKTVNKTVNKTRVCQCGSVEVYFDRENGEVICSKCLVLNSRENFENKLPFDTTYALTNNLALQVWIAVIVWSWRLLTGHNLEFAAFLTGVFTGGASTSPVSSSSPPISSRE